MLNDFRLAVRLLRRNPGFTAATVLTLALGVGLDTGVCTLVRAVLFRPLPFYDPERVVAVWTDRRDQLGRDRSDVPQTAGAFSDWHVGNQSFAELAAIQLWKNDYSARFDLIAPDGAERLRGALATPNFFHMTGIQAALGRTFTDADSPETLGQSAVLSDGLWRRRFGADPSIIGHTLTVLGGRERKPYALTVVGVLPREFRFTYPDETELWVPLTWDQVGKQPRGAVMYQVMGRLKGGVTASDAAADLLRINQRAAATHTRETYRTEDVPRVAPVREYLSRSARPVLIALAGVGAFVLLIGCANVGNLLLARNLARSRELATRVALGASRLQLVRQALAESLTISLLGAAAGTLFAFAALPVMRSIVPASLPRGHEMRIDAAVLAVCAGALILAVVVATVPFFLVAGSRETEPALREGAGATRAGQRWRQLTIAVQVAAVCVLLMGAGLLLQSFWRLTHVDLGFDGADVLTMEMRVIRERYRDRAKDEARLVRFENAVGERLRAIPGVKEAAITSAVPLRGTDWMSRFEVVEGVTGGKGALVANERQVTPEYFRLMHIPLIAGRVFTAADDRSAPARAAVSRALARLIAPSDADVLGRHLALDVPTEIVGVVGDVRATSFSEAPRPAYYLPRAQSPSELVCLVIRVAPGQSASVVAATLRAIHEIDPQQPVERVTTLDRIANDSIADRKFYAAITAAFAAIGLLLALVGLAGVVSRYVVERTREIGIRMALGADAASLRTHIVVKCVTPVVFGLAAGAIASWWLTRWIQSQLYVVTPHDPATLIGASVTILLAATAVALLSGSRATRIDPVRALRTE